MSITKLKFEDPERIAAAYMNHPTRVANDVKKAMRELLRPMTSSLKSKLPQKAKKLVKSQIKGTNSVSMIWGVFGKTKSGGVDFEYLKLYYRTYGTLGNRSKTHKFIEQRKEKTIKWKGGIKENMEIPDFIDAKLNEFATKLKNKLDDR